MSLYKHQFTDTFEIKDGERIFNLKACYAFLQSQGKSIYGQSFELHPSKFQLYRALLIYAIQDHQMAQQLNVDLNKGVLLMGASGSGKTCMMHLLKPFFYSKRQYNIKNCRTVGVEFSKKGYDIIEQYTEIQSDIKKINHICFDDLGNETNTKHFGSSCNYMKDIIELRYEQFHTQKQLTHITTMLNPSQIEKKYGKGFREKLRDMSNVFLVTK